MNNTIDFNTAKTIDTMSKKIDHIDDTVSGFFSFMHMVMLYIFGCGLYTLFRGEWMQFLILLVAEFGCFVLVFAGTAVVDAAERFSGWLAGLGGSNE